MHVLFLDANILFSAAYRDDPPLRELWKLPETELVTSSYALGEAERNLPRVEQKRRLGALVEGVRVVHVSGSWALPPDVALPDKDQPILSGAIICGATHLVTGDQTHFGALCGRQVSGVTVVRPAAYLQSRAPKARVAERSG